MDLHTSGCFVTGLEYSTGKSAVVVGKPEKEFFHSAVEHMKGLNPTLDSLKLEGNFRDVVDLDHLSRSLKFLWSS